MTRMLTVVTTLKSQQRHILESIATAVANAREFFEEPRFLYENT
ncbi:MULTISPECIES: hypothetical protein [Oscillatoriales]|nr:MULTISPECIES: hypothetical protein [Oscillatoriales]